MIEGQILIVEDELSIRKFMILNLKRANFDVVEAGSGGEAIKMVNEQVPSLVVLDIMLPDMDGFEVCTRLRESHPNLPIIIVSARGQDMEKVMGLELGADDYIVKPFNPLELVARIRTVLRRSNHNVHKQLKAGPFVLDLKTQRVFKNEKRIKLTVREFQLMKLFIEKINEPMTRDDLLDEIWGLNYFGDPKTVDVHIRRLREKIEDDPSNPLFLKTVWGFGYSFQESENEE